MNARTVAPESAAYGAISREVITEHQFEFVIQLVRKVSLHKRE